MKSVVWPKMRKLDQVIRWKGIPKYVIAKVDETFSTISYVF